MKKHLLAMSALGLISSQAAAFEFKNAPEN